MNGRPLRLLALLGTTLATVATSAAVVAPVSATPLPAGRLAPAHEPPWTVVAEGLNNPRLLSFDRSGRLFVAEAGKGGAGPCIEGPEGEVCFGRSGAISLVGPTGARRVATRFPSLAGEDGSAALGPTDVVVDRNGHFVASIGLGADPAARADLPRSGRRFLGTLTEGWLDTRTRHVLADLASYEAANDPDGADPDSNPVGFLRRGRGFMAVDAGANALLKVTRNGTISTRAVFGTREVPNPFGGDDIDMQAVPTSVASGPRGVLYVSQLTGFPFPQGEARIFRVRKGRTSVVHATGLTNLTDLAWHGGHLYAVQLADDGLLGVPEGELPMGSLVRVDPGGNHVTVAHHLPAPYGVAFRRGTAYVTTCSVCAGAGEVVRIPLRH